MQDYKRLFLSLVVVAVLIAVGVQGQIHVSPQGSIQEALNSAQPGQEITVESGAYPEDLIVSKSAALLGLDTGGGWPVLSGFITIASDNVSMQGFGFDARKEVRPAEADCRLNVAGPCETYLNNFAGSWLVCPDSCGFWNSSQPITYQFESRVKRSRLGNYWADYQGVDDNRDGIGDLPMNISPGIVDYYPLMQPADAYHLQGSMETKMEHIKARVNEPFTIRLRSNPTTGYQWYPDYDYYLLSLVAEDFERGSTEALGASGTSVLVFKPLRSGKTKIALVYRRPWENIVADVRTYLVDIEGDV
jgi:inhibitor of cysteine peptidase